MSTKRIRIVIIIFLLAVFGIAIMNVSHYVNIEKYHDYYSIEDFEKETGMNFYDVYNFKMFVNENQKSLLTQEDNISIHANDYDDLEYSVSFESENWNSYKFDYAFTGELITRDYQVEQIDNYTLYSYSEEDNQSVIFFIVTSGDFKYEFQYDNAKGLEDFYIIEKAKDYVRLNDEFHKGE